MTKNNEIIILDDFAILKIHSDAHGDFEFILDLDDVEKCTPYNWSVQTIYHRKNKIYYAKAKIDNKNMLLHRYLLNIEHSKTVVDHIDGNSMNNRKENLRAITQKQNGWNKRHMNLDSSSGMIGVYFYNYCKTPKWVAYITINGVRKHLGYFNTKEEAVKCRLAAEKKYYGEFMRQDEILQDNQD